MRDELKRAIHDRILREIAPQSPLKILKVVDLEDAINIAISIVYLYTRMKRGVNKTVYMAEIISAIGHNIINKNKLKRDSSLAAKIGAFFLFSFETHGFVEVQLGQGNKSHAAYIVKINDDEGLNSLWETIPESKIEKLPSLVPYSPWQTARHESGSAMVKTGNRDVIAAISIEDHPILFSCLNKAQKIGWQVNAEVLEIYQWALRNRSDAFNEIWEQRNPEAKATKLREAKAIGAMAKRFSGTTFYHLYYYDFRGRKYPTTAYLHEQGSDLARGLLQKETPRTIGERGLFWMFVMLANYWAGDSGRDDGLKTDKIPLQDRFMWAEDNLEIFLSYAESPKVNQGWMKADKPWQFLATCIEVRNAFREENPWNYQSRLEGYIDGSNNGSQHLTALVRDESTAPHVNLVPMELPGDLYKYVADSVWAAMQEMANKSSTEQIKEANVYIDNIVELKKQISQTEPKSDARKNLSKMLEELRAENSHLHYISAIVFWLRITDAKHQRKIVKRNVMTLPYGGTAFGLGQQQIDDAKKHGIESLLFMEHRWGAFLGRFIYENCRVSLAKLMQLLSIFEEAGKAAEEDHRFLSWTVPVTNFPVVQNYTQGKVRKVWVQYGPPIGSRLSTGYYQNTLQMNISFIEDVEPSKGKQSQGASPNLIHSLDAAHLAMIVHEADFDVTTIHDSFGAAFADMDKLYTLVRETFIELYKTDPLAHLMSDINADIATVTYGTLDIELIRESEYCFI